MSIEQGWVPIALSANIEPGSSAGAVIGGAEIVVWRDDKGAPHVWEDRCPHRGMRMSFGFVRGDHIACLYHGWSYDSGGQCRYIPAHPDLEVPQTIKIPTYAVAERNGIIWTSLAADADIAGVPDVAGEATPVRSLYVDCPLDAVKAALAAARLPTAGGPEEPAVVEPVLGHCLILAAGTTRLLAALQAIGPEGTAVHAVLLGSPDETRALRAPMAKWAESFRRAVEVQAMAEVA